MRTHAQILLAVGLAGLGRPAEAVEPGVAALRSVVTAGRVEDGVVLRTALAACARALGDPLAGSEILRPVVSAEGVSPAVSARAMAELAACLSHVAGRDDVEDAFAEADRLLAADEGLSPARRRLERALVCANTAAYHRRYGDTEAAADAAHEGLAILGHADGTDPDQSAVRASLVYELALALLDDGALNDAVTACAPLLAEPVRATTAPPVARLRMAIATRVHIPAGRTDLGRTLLLDTVDTAQRHGLDSILADAWTFLANTEENTARPVEALHALRSARAAEHRHHRAASRARRILTAEFAPERDPTRGATLLNTVVRPHAPTIPLPAQHRRHTPTQPSDGRQPTTAAPHPEPPPPRTAPSDPAGMPLSGAWTSTTDSPGPAGRSARTTSEADQGAPTPSPSHDSDETPTRRSRHASPPDPGSPAPEMSPLAADSLSPTGNPSPVDHGQRPQNEIVVPEAGRTDAARPESRWRDGEPHPRGVEPEEHPRPGPDSAASRFGFHRDAGVVGPRVESRHVPVEGAQPGVAGREPEKETSPVGRHEAPDNGRDPSASADTPDLRDEDPGFTLILVRAEPIGHPDAIEPEEPALPVGDDAMINALASRVRDLAPTGTDLVRCDRGEFAVLLPRTPTVIAEQFASIIRKQAGRGPWLADVVGRPVTVRTAVANHAAAGVARGLDSLLTVARAALRGEPAPAAGLHGEPSPTLLSSESAPTGTPTALRDESAPAATPHSEPTPATPTVFGDESAVTRTGRRGESTPTVFGDESGSAVTRTGRRGESTPPVVGDEPGATAARTGLRGESATSAPPTTGSTPSTTPASRHGESAPGASPAIPRPSRRERRAAAPSDAHEVLSRFGITAAGGGRRRAPDDDLDPYLTVGAAIPAQAARPADPEPDEVPPVEPAPEEIPPIEPGPDQVPVRPDPGGIPPVEPAPNEVPPVRPNPSEIPDEKPSAASLLDRLSKLASGEPAADRPGRRAAAPEAADRLGRRASGEPAPDVISRLGRLASGESAPGSIGRTGKRAASDSAARAGRAVSGDRRNQLPDLPTPDTPGRTASGEKDSVSEQAASDPAEPPATPVRRADSAVIPRPSPAMAEWLRRAGRPLPDDDLPAADQADDPAPASPDPAPPAPDPAPATQAPATPSETAAAEPPPPVNGAPADATQSRPRRRERSSSDLANLLTEALAAFQETHPAQDWADEPERPSPLDAALAARRPLPGPVRPNEGGRRRAPDDHEPTDVGQASGRRAARRAREERWVADARAADPDSPPPARTFSWRPDEGGRHRSSGWAPADVDGG
ncbi:hypothetical protein [Actinokineospora sp. UTMC 2448]|uniref:hypothetical protein n=1 Tax=Actinokineospora sp. UTMC 2448 TaxID=2268449 RepID=UPI0021648000|nr:hypothetical protein [Actinokineospora sp. UTMC 2448]